MCAARCRRSFYQSVVASPTLFVAVCWGNRIRVSDTSKLNKVIRKAGSALGASPEPLEVVVGSGMLLCIYIQYLRKYSI